jgi:hypothetical protein
MALIVEDGTGLANAESYASVAESITYHNNQGASQWAGITTAQQEQALRRATEYLLGQYPATNWKGSRLSGDQSLDWPRANVQIKDGNTMLSVASNTVPQRVKNACCSLALRAAAGKLLNDQGQRKSSVTVGAISTSYAEGSSPEIRYVEIDNILKIYLKSFGSQVQMVRR